MHHKGSFINYSEWTMLTVVESKCEGGREEWELWILGGISVVLGFDLKPHMKQALYCFSNFASPFLCLVFSRYGLTNISLGWLEATILMISSSWVVNIAGVSPSSWIYSVLLWNKKESKKDIKYLRETSHHFLLPCLRKCPTVLSISPKGWIWTPNLGFKFQPPP
jgi:hypothetical protein